MSYNITNWQVKKLENLTIPLSALYEHPREDFHPWYPQLNPKTNEVIIYGIGEGYIRGSLDNKKDIVVTEIKCYGEFSGIHYREILKPTLAYSRGELIVVIIWEGGESINRLTVIDGNVTEKDVEL